MKARQVAQIYALVRQEGRGRRCKEKKNIEASVSDSKAQDDGKLLQKRLDSAWLIDLFTS